MQWRRLWLDNLADFIGGYTSIVGMSRYITDYPVEIVITAGGEKLWHYVFTNDGLGGFAPSDVDYSLLEDAEGVFSSRFTTWSRVRLAGETVPDLLAMTKYRFVFIGGKNDTDECP